MAIITTLLVLMLISALLVGFTAVVMSDQRYRFIDRDRGQAFYAASGAMEKMTADLGNLFFTNVAPTGTQVTALTAAAVKPVIAGVSYTGSAPDALPSSSLVTGCTGAGKTITTVGTNGYTIKFCADANGNPSVVSPPLPIKTGPYEGLIAEQAPYQLDVTAKTSTGGEVHLVRTIESVAIPVFQFGMFSDVDLAFNAGDDMSFGGRVHTNGNLFLAEAAASTLTLSDKVTAVKEVVRTRLSNGVAVTTSGHTGIVKLAKAPGTYRNMASNEGSVVDGPTSALNDPTWTTISLSTYNSYIRNGRTGAKALNLPLITAGGTNPDLIKRPAPNEDVDKPILYGERLYSKASLRILLSDTSPDITGLPQPGGGAPISLDGDWLTTPPNTGVAYGPINTLHPPVARTPGPLTTIVAQIGGNTGACAGNPVTCSIKVANAAALVPFKPLMRLRLGAATSIITCTAKDAANNRFTGCNVPAAFAINSTLEAGPNVPAALQVWPVSTNVPAAVGVGAAVTITVAAGQTVAFQPAPFWIGNTLITCTGWDATPAYTGCSGIAAPAANGALMTNYARANAGTGTLGGFIKADLQWTDGTWHDVTMELLNWGIGAPNQVGTQCADPTPNAIIRLQRLRDNGGSACTYNGDTTGARDSMNWWPNTLFDTREALPRDVDPGGANVILGGVMHYVSIDATNLAKWFRATAPYNTGSGANGRKDNGGFTVYFSDRRNNRDGANRETGEYGWEDFVNPLSATAAPNSSLDVGEDVNANNALDTYGQATTYNGASGQAPPGAVAPLTTAARPWTFVAPAEAFTNRAVLFRRALKLVNGANLASTGITGLTIVAENPVYVQGDWNANGAFTDPHAATSVICDAITFLSNAWSDDNSYTSPFSPNGRPRAANTWIRMAVIAGKGAIFPQPAGTGSTFGTDGGAHAFTRFLEGTGAAPDAVHYRGSLATFFYNRQAVGPFKGSGAVVYNIPSFRDYVFDIDFLDPALLPPNTPVFRDMNAVGFSQELRPNK
jgi:hypothetical protein